MISVSMRNFFIYFILYLSIPYAFSEPYEWPDISSDEAKVKLLLFVEKLYPNLFEGMTAHDTDLLWTLTTQERFLKELGQDPRFKDFLKTHGERKKISAAIRKDVPLPKVEVDVPAFNKAVQDAKDGIDLIPTQGDFKGNLREAIIKQVLIEFGSTTDKAAGRLADFVPPENKKDFYKKSAQDKIKSFENGEYKDKASDTKVQEFLQAALRARQRDETLKKLISLQALTEGNDSLTHDKVIAFLSQLKPEEYAPNLSDPDGVLKSVKSLLLTPRSGSKTEFTEGKIMQSRDSIKDSVREHTTALKASQRPKPPEPISQVTLTEVPAWLAIFRGCVGGDCASKNLAAYSHSPHTKIFYIDTGHGEPSGYIETAVVESGGKKYLYAFTMNGNSLNADHTEAVYRALHEARKDLGVEGIILPLKDRLARNINYNVIRDKVAEFVGDKQEFSFEFLDADLRREIGLKHFVNTDAYHSPDNIKSGVLWAPEPMKDNRIDVTVEKALDPVLDKEPIHKGRALMLALELAHKAVKPQYTHLQLNNLGKKQEHVDYDHGKRIELIDRILAAAKVPKEDFEHLRKVLRNEEGRKFEDVVADVTSGLKKHDYQVDPKFKTTSITPFLPALLRSSNALEKTWKEKTIAGTLTLLTQEVEPELVAETLKKSPDLFKDHSRLKNILIKANKYEDTRIYYKAWNYADVVGKSGISLASMSDMVEELRAKLKMDNTYQNKAAAGSLIKLKAHGAEVIETLKALSKNGEAVDPELEAMLEEAKAYHPEAGSVSLVDCRKAALKAAGEPVATKSP